MHIWFTGRFLELPAIVLPLTRNKISGFEFTYFIAKGRRTLMGSHCEAMRTEIQNLVLQVHLHRSNYCWVTFECIKHVKSIFTPQCAHCTTRGVVVRGEATERSGCWSVNLRTSVHTTVMSALCPCLHMSRRPCVLWPIALLSVPSSEQEEMSW